MSKNTRVLQSGVCEITQEYKKGEHEGIDIVKKGYQLDNIVAHSDGKVVQVIKNCNINTSGKNGNTLDKNNLGNLIKIDHGNGYYTRYLHLKYGSVKVNVGDIVKKGEIIGYMGNTGYSFGGHLHFEVWNKNIRIDPTIYLEKNFPNLKNDLINYNKYKIGDIVTIDGVFVSSTSTDKLKPAITIGKITKIIENANNPYLLNDGKIGWVNDNCIVNSIIYLSNKNYNGFSIVDALKQINVNYSYEFRNQLAKNNGITDYVGSANQNIKLLKLLQNGKLKMNMSEQK